MTPSSKSPSVYPSSESSQQTLEKILEDNNIPDLKNFKKHDQTDTFTQTLENKNKAEEYEKDLFSLDTRIDGVIEQMKPLEWAKQPLKQSLPETNFIMLGIMVSLYDMFEAVHESGKQYDMSSVSPSKLLALPEIKNFPRQIALLKISDEIMKSSFPEGSAGAYIQSSWETYTRNLIQSFEINSPQEKSEQEKKESVSPGNNAALIGAGLGALRKDSLAGSIKNMIIGGLLGHVGSHVRKSINSSNQKGEFFNKVGEGIVLSAHDLLSKGEGVLNYYRDPNIPPEKKQEHSIGIVMSGALAIGAIKGARWMWDNRGEKKSNKKKGNSWWKWGAGIIALFGSLGIGKLLLGENWKETLEKIFSGKMTEVIPDAQNRVKDTVGQDVNNQTIENDEVKQKTLINLTILKNQNTDKPNFIHAIQALEKAISETNIFPSRLFRHLGIAGQKEGVTPPPSNSFDQASQTYTLSFGPNIHFTNLTENPLLTEDPELLDQQRTDHVLEGLGVLQSKLEEKGYNEDSDIVQLTQKIKDSVEKNGYQSFTESNKNLLITKLKQEGFTVKETSRGAITIKHSDDYNTATIGISPSQSQEEYEKQKKYIDKGFWELSKEKYSESYQGIMSNIADELDSQLQKKSLKNEKRIREVIARLRDKETFDSPSTLLTLLQVIEENDDIPFFGFALTNGPKDSDNNLLMLKIGAIHYPFQAISEVRDQYSHLFQGEFSEFGASSLALAGSVPTLVVGGMAQSLHLLGDKVLDTENAGSVRKVSGKGVKRVVWVFRKLFWQLPLSPYYLGKASFKSLRGIKNTPYVFHAIKHPRTLAYKWGENLRSKENILSHSGVSGMIWNHKLNTYEKKAIRLMEERLILERNRAMYLNSNELHVLGKQGVIDDIDKQLETNSTRFKRNQKNLPSVHDWYVEKDFDVDKYSRNHETVQEIKKMKGIPLGNPHEPSEKTSQDTKEKEKETRKNTIKTKTVHPKNTTVYELNSEIKKEENKIEKLQYSQKTGITNHALEKNKENIKVAEEKIKNLNKRLLNIKEIKKQPFYGKSGETVDHSSLSPEQQKNINNQAERITNKHNLSSKQQIDLQKNISKGVKTIGYASMIMSLTHIAEADNVHSAILESITYGALYAGAMRTGAYAPVAMSTLALCQIIWGKEAVDKFNAVTKTLEENIIDPNEVSEDYITFGNIVSGGVNRSYAPLEAIWDDTIGEFWKGDNAMEYFSDTIYYNQYIATASPTLNGLIGGIAGNKVMHRGKQDIDQWNTHIDNRIASVQKSIRLIKTQLSEYTLDRGINVFHNKNKKKMLESLLKNLIQKEKDLPLEKIEKDSPWVQKKVSEITQETNNLFIGIESTQVIFYRSLHKFLEKVEVIHNLGFLHTLSPKEKENLRSLIESIIQKRKAPLPPYLKSKVKSMYTKIFSFEDAQIESFKEIPE